MISFETEVKELGYKEIRNTSSSQQNANSTAYEKPFMDKKGNIKYIIRLFVYGNVSNPSFSLSNRAEAEVCFSPEIKLDEVVPTVWVTVSFISFINLETIVEQLWKVSNKWKGEF